MNIILIGAGGQARVIIDILQYDKNNKLVGIIDKQFSEGEMINNVPILGTFSDLPKVIEEYAVTGAIIGVGDNRLRAEYYNLLKSKGLEMINAVHPSVSIANNVVLGDGNVICRKAVICTNAKIGNNTIINTSAIVEHECVVGDHAHVAPGTNIAGRVTIDSGAFVGIGSTVIQGIKIGKYSVVGAGSIVINDIPSEVVAVGTPCKIIKKINENIWFGEQQAHEIKEDT